MPRFHIYSASCCPREHTNKLQPTKQDVKRCKPTTLYARSKIKQNFPKPPRFCAPRQPILCNHKNKTVVVIQKIFRHRKQKTYGNQGNAERSHSRYNALAQLLYVCIPDRGQSEKTSVGREAAVHWAVDRDSQVRSKEVVHYAIYFSGYVAGIRDRLGDWRERRNVAGNEGESSQVMSMRIMYRNAKKLEQGGIKGIVHAKLVSWEW